MLFKRILMIYRGWESASSVVPEWLNLACSVVGNMLRLVLLGLIALQCHLCVAQDNDFDDIILSELVPVPLTEREDDVLMDEYESPPIEEPATLSDPPVLSDSPNNRIVGGQEADIIDYPHQVSFIVNNSYFCGGFIVSEYYILTAGHCAQNVDPTTVVLRAGSSWRQNGTVIPIAEVIPHPQYDDPKFDKDVAVMKTVNPMNFSTTMRPIPLPPRGRPMEGGSKIIVSGWGRMENGASTIPKRLMHVELPVIYHLECRLTYITVLTSNEFCAGNFFLGGKSTCQGDSGGAATQDGMAVGIVSFGRGCGQSLSPSVFADIASPPIRNFITEHTGL
ncbi:hypothetical protein ACJJTC_011341 [Scirpophaga incertulas]